MCEDVENENFPGLVVHSGDQPVVITVNIEHRPPADHLGMGKISVNVGEGFAIWLDARFGTSSSTGPKRPGVFCRI